MGNSNNTSAFRDCVQMLRYMCCHCVFAFAQLIEMPAPYGDCSNELNYTQSACLYACLADYIIAKCHCREIYMPGQYRPIVSLLFIADQQASLIAVHLSYAIHSVPSEPLRCP